MKERAPVYVLRSDVTFDVSRFPRVTEYNGKKIESLSFVCMSWFWVPYVRRQIKALSLGRRTIRTFTHSAIRCGPWRHEGNAKAMEKQPPRDRIVNAVARRGNKGSLHARTSTGSVEPCCIRRRPRLPALWRAHTRRLLTRSCCRLPSPPRVIRTT